MQNELEIELMKSMISLITRYPDGLERIEAVFEAVVEVGEDLKEQICGWKPLRIH